MPASSRFSIRSQTNCRRKIQMMMMTTTWAQIYLINLMKSLCLYGKRLELISKKFVQRKRFPEGIRSSNFVLLILF